MEGPVFDEWANSLKGMADDKLAPAQEKGLETLVSFLKGCSIKQSAKVAAAICPILVDKGFKGRAGIKKFSVEAIELFVELENTDVVIDSLIKGAICKTPKVNEVSIETLASLIDQFGAKELPVKPILAQLCNFFNNSNGEVREQATELAVQLFRWLGNAVKSTIESLRGAQVKDLEQKFEKAEKAKVKRYLRSKQPKKEVISKQSGDEEEGEEGGGNVVAEEEEIDPYSIMDPVDILSKLPSDYYSLLKSKKWQERKQSIDGLISIASVPKIQNGDYNEVVKSLNQVITKDVNIQCAASACKAVQLLVEGVRADFTPHAKKLIEGILAKLKEKKDLILQPVHASLDGIIKFCIPLNEAFEFINPSLQHKMPAVRKETCDFLLRTLVYTTLDDLQKSLKNLSTCAINLLNDSDPAVRDVAASILGSLVSIFGERKMSPILSQLDKVKAKKVEESIPKEPIKRLHKDLPQQPPKPKPSTSTSRSSTPPQQQQPPPQDTKKDPPKQPEKKPAEVKQPEKKPVNNNDVKPPPEKKPVEVKQPEKKPTTNDSKSSTTTTNDSKSSSNLKNKSSSSNQTQTQSSNNEKDYGFEPIEDLEIEEVPSSPTKQEELYLNENNEKGNRAKKHQTTFEWSFSKKYVELGKYFVSEAQKNINEPLYSLMVSPNDDKKHLKAIEMIETFFKDSNASSHKLKVIMDNMDILLKWFTLRFFDTNINVFNCALKSLQSLFSLLVEKDQRLDEYDARIFLPFVIGKGIGILNDITTEKLKQLTLQLCHLYPASKIVMYLVQYGIKPNTCSVKTKTSCLELIGMIINSQGIHSIVQPSKLLLLFHSFTKDKNPLLKKQVLNLISIFHHCLGDNEFWKNVSSTQKKEFEEIIKKNPYSSLLLPPSSSTINNNNLNNNLLNSPQNNFSNQTSQSTHSSPLTHPSSSSFNENLSLPNLHNQHNNNNNQHNNNNFQNNNFPSYNEKVLHPTLSKWLEEMKTEDPTKIIEQSKLIFLNLNENNDVKIFENAVNELLSVLTLHYYKLFQKDSRFYLFNSILVVGNNESAISNNIYVRLCKYLINTILQIVQNISLSKNISKINIQLLISNILVQLVDKNISSLKSEGASILKALNVLMFRVLENCDTTLTLSVLLELLSQYNSSYEESKNENDYKLIDLAMKCILKITKSLSRSSSSNSNSNENKLDWSIVLKDIHLFLSKYSDMYNPSSYPTTNMPLQTVKTLLNELVKIKGAQILNFLSLVPLLTPTSLSEEPIQPLIRSYIQLMLQSKVKIENSNPLSPSHTPSSSSFSSDQKVNPSSNSLFSQNNLKPPQNNNNNNFNNNNINQESSAPFTVDSSLLSTSSKSLSQNIEKLRSKLAFLRSSTLESEYTKSHIVEIPVKESLPNPSNLPKIQEPNKENKLNTNFPLPSSNLPNLTNLKDRLSKIKQSVNENN